MVKGRLQLKRELAPMPIQAPVGDAVLAHVWVDASVYHLDTPFSYLIPGNLDGKVFVGSLISVPFHGREVIGLVISITVPHERAGLKSISKAIGNFPLLTPDLIQLITLACTRYAAHPFDLIRSALPDRVAAIEKKYTEQKYSENKYTEKKSIFQASIGNGRRSYLQLPPAVHRIKLLSKKVISLSKEGGVLVLLPDSREVSALAHELATEEAEFSLLDSSLGKSEYYENFLQARLGINTIVIGTRSAIFAPVSALRSILIYNEGSEHFYERRTPGWNVRDIALLRTHIENVDLYFAGYSPSTEAARFIEENWFEYKRTRGRTKVSTYAQINGELLPSRAIAPIRTALKGGPVLFVVPLKGYAQAIRCAQCRTISRCTCGGAHEKKTLISAITCNHCLKVETHWKCAWCNNEQPSYQSRGIERHHHELGLLFPQVPIHLSTREHQFLDVASSGIIIVTPGMAPPTLDGYSAVVILEGNRFLNQPDMRSGERMREMYFAHAALAQSMAPVILIQDEGHSIATSLATWNPTTAIGYELEERKSLGLPPYVRSATLTMESSDITRLKSSLEGAQAEGRLPVTAKIMGPIPSGDKSSLILTVDLIHGQELISTIHEFMRRRSAAKKTLPSLRIDPYSLSH